MAQSVRRVVTGQNAAGESVFLLDAELQETFSRGSGTTSVTDIWATRESPADNSGDCDAVVGPFCLPPPKSGTVFRILRIPPDSERIDAMRKAALSFSGKEEGYSRDFANIRHPGFHKTASTDYVVVLSGEIYALVDEGEKLLRPGDVFVQRGTSHAWSNRGKQSAVLAVILVDARPI